MMPTTHTRHTRRLQLLRTGLLAAGLTVTAAVPALAQPIPSPNASAAVIYPAKGQSAKQQDQDRYECHDWARAHSGYDPTAAAQAPIASPTVATAATKPSASTAGAMAGGAIGGAAVAELTKGDVGRGAAAGALGGTVVQRLKQQQAQAQQMQHQAALQQQAAQQQARASSQRSTYERALGACMEGRGYTVR